MSTVGYYFEQKNEELFCLKCNVLNFVKDASRCVIQ